MVVEEVEVVEEVAEEEGRVEEEGGSGARACSEVPQLGLGLGLGLGLPAARCRGRSRSRVGHAACRGGGRTYTWWGARLGLGVRGEGGDWGEG